MSLHGCQCSEIDKSIRIKEIVTACGAIACGITECTEVDRSDAEVYRSWLHGGYNADMDYMIRNNEVRFDPRHLLTGAQTIIATAFNYRPVNSSPVVADYALGLDYHYVVKQRLQSAADTICTEFGGQARVITDSVPLRERWWAQQAGIAYRGDNGLVIVDGYGSAVFLGFVLWTGTAANDKPNRNECLHCGACIRACPGNAITSEGLIDARRCLSYLTIEHRGEFPQHMPKLNKVYGCDICRKVCPLDKGPSSNISEFKISEAIENINIAAMTEIGSGDFRRMFGKSAIFRLRPTGLRRNALRYICDNPKKKLTLIGD